MWTRIAVVVGVIVLLLAVVFASIDEPLRRYAENRANEAFPGYTVRIGALDLHPLSLSVDLKDLTLEALEKPLLSLPRWNAHLQWAKLLKGELVSEHRLDNPTVTIDRSQAEAELDKETNLVERGWQAAVLQVYPFAINRLEIHEGTFSYRERPDRPPLELRHIEATAENIRNVDSPDHTYPSTVSIEADVFSTGHLSIKGGADFLAQPFAGVDVDFDLREIPLADLLPLAGRFNLQLRGGILRAAGHTEYSPKARRAMCSSLNVDGLRMDFVHQTKTRAREQQVVRAAEKGASNTTDATRLELEIKEGHLSDAEVGFVDESAHPQYRVFVSHLDADLRDFSNRQEAGPSDIQVKGKFMGSGSLSATGRFRPSAATPDFSLAVKILHTRLKSLNDVFRAHADVDVTKGSFAFFSEVTVKKGSMKGYLKPLFKDIDVYDPEEDEGKGFFQQVYEGLVDTLTGILENDVRDEVATTTDVSGPLADPRTSTWQVLVNLIKNAFFQAILPGFQQQAGQGR
ncbi:hypothetical protein YTPLAS18_14920 [Nitrospira sp.]|nr:hypothetical protein YTPLAS18_14920 [Nitrospira sp.]